MTSSLRFPFGLALLLMLAVTSPTQAQTSMMIKTSPSPVGDAGSINRGDFNNDGILDVVVNGGGSILVYPGNGDGTFGSPIATQNSQQTVDLAVGDFNNDGNLDLALTNINSPTVQIFFGNGDGTFTAGPIITFRDVPRSITASDFNNDGNVDLAVGVGNTTNEVDILQGDGSGNFTLATTIPLFATSDVTTVFHVRVGDFNRDGAADVAVLQNHALTVLFGRGDLTFDQEVLNNQYVETADMTVGDLNRDGFTDIMVSFQTAGCCNVPGGVDIYYGTAGEAMIFQNAIAPNSGLDTPRQLIAADVDGDGVDDIVALEVDLTPQLNDGVYVWLGNPDGTFQQTPSRFIYTSERDRTALVAGDFNRDGKIDFFVARSSLPKVEVLLNATPRAACQPRTADQSVTVCQPQDSTASNSPLHIIAQGNSSNGIAAMQVYVDDVLQQDFSTSSFDAFFNLPLGDHFLVVKGWDSTGASFRSDRHVNIFNGTPGQTCATPSSALSVTVCLPAQNASLSSPVQVLANSWAPDSIAAIQVYIDDNLVFDDPTATWLNQNFDLAPGSHNIVVKAWDANGTPISDSRTVTVN